VLLSKLQEKRGGNPQVQLISVESHRVDPRFIVIIRGGSSTGEDMMTPAKTTDESRVRRTAEKTLEFDSRKEKNIFEKERREFGGYQVSSSKEQP
jgi:hypothetical protein